MTRYFYGKPSGGTSHPLGGSLVRKESFKRIIVHSYMYKWNELTQYNQSVNDLAFQYRLTSIMNALKIWSFPTWSETQPIGKKTGESSTSKKYCQKLPQLICYSKVIHYKYSLTVCTNKVKSTRIPLTEPIHSEQKLISKPFPTLLIVKTENYRPIV